MAYKHDRPKDSLLEASLAICALVCVMLFLLWLVASHRIVYGLGGPQFLEPEICQFGAHGRHEEVRIRHAAILAEDAPRGSRPWWPAACSALVAVLRSRLHAG